MPVLDGQHRLFSIMNAVQGQKARNHSGDQLLNGPKKRQATKFVARLDNQRRSNVSEWSNYNTYR